MEPKISLFAWALVLLKDQVPSPFQKRVGSATAALSPTTTYQVVGFGKDKGKLKTTTNFIDYLFQQYVQLAKVIEPAFPYAPAFEAVLPRLGIYRPHSSYCPSDIARTSLHVVRTVTHSGASYHLAGTGTIPLGVEAPQPHTYLCQRQGEEADGVPVLRSSFHSGMDEMLFRLSALPPKEGDSVNKVVDMVKVSSLFVTAVNTIVHCRVGDQAKKLAVNPKMVLCVKGFLVVASCTDSKPCVDLARIVAEPVFSRYLTVHQNNTKMCSSVSNAPATHSTYSMPFQCLLIGGARVPNPQALGVLEF
ncbi:hypothetical protein JCM11641_002315 [Rhodosporidiobolus odoratus]